MLGHWERVPKGERVEDSYVPGTPVPPGYHIEERRPRWAVITGTALLVPAYLTTLLFVGGTKCQSTPIFRPGVVYQYECHSREVLAVPVVGPFIDVARGTNGDDLIMDYLLGIGQLTGAAFLIAGLTVTTSNLVPDRPRSGITFTPMLASNTTGMMLTWRP